jgi:rhamnosyltransferase
MTVAAVFVTYNPDPEGLSSSLQSILDQVDFCIVVDNGSNRKLELSCHSKATLVPLERNFGIAYAQNVGVNLSLSRGCSHILLSDQDTFFPPDFVASMTANMLRFGDAGVAAYTPIFFDSIKGSLAPVMVTKSRATQPEADRIYSISHAISSATIIPVKMFQRVGLFNEALFIDFVDNEWCWRAKRLGFRILSFPSVVVRHSLGEATKRFVGRSMTTRSIFRYYYIFRNGFYLLRTNLLDFFEKVAFLRFLAVRFVALNVLEKLTLRERWKLCGAIFGGCRKRLKEY